MITATGKHLQCWGSATYNRVETKQEIPKLKLLVGWSSKPKQTPLYRMATNVFARISIW